ncbi:DNA alkylation repair protein [Arcobacter sp. LA11]|uniref:DNA alkylation repair protein n=1 Tax=Arcobacter sp. LA11 TaxID=1898176 RepID=UPI000932A5F6|nr:DNA alkylation repair protein [Arcobacter sp. LA11]
MTKKIYTELDTYSDKQRALDCKRFFKTNIGEYAYGDEFLGIKAPDIRNIVKKYFLELSLDDIKEFLYSKYHEHRMFALLVLVYKYKTKRFTTDEQREEIFNFYIKNTKQINNWDLIDVTAPHIVGVYLLDKDRSILYEFAFSEDLWKKRISIVSTFALINNKEYEDTLKLADILLHDEHDLIHKAVGWAIRNVGIKDLDTMFNFLNPRYKTMPRTMLRYAIEKLPKELRQKYLKGQI